MKKAKMMIAGLAAALTLTFASGHAMAADISTSTPLMLRVSQWAAQECCGRRNSENCPSVCDGTGNRTARFHVTAPVIRTAQIRAAAMAMATAVDRETATMAAVTAADRDFATVPAGCKIFPSKKMAMRCFSSASAASLFSLSDFDTEANPLPVQFPSRTSSPHFFHCPLHL